MPNILGSKMSSKIINFDFENDKIILSKLNALPQAVKAIYEKSHSLIMQKLTGYFDQLDDALFESADKAFSSQEQNVYFDAMRELRIQRQGIEKRFMLGISHAFIDLIQSTNPSRPENASLEAFSSDALSLVGNDDLEEMVALDTSINHANSHYGEAIQHISLRLDSVLPVKIYQKNNPIGPDVLCHIFMSQIKRLDIDIKAKLIVFKLFDRRLISDLSDLYDAINNDLISHNILPSLSAASVRQKNMDQHNIQSNSSLRSSSNSLNASYKSHSDTQPSLLSSTDCQIINEDMIAKLKHFLSSSDVKSEDVDKNTTISSSVLALTKIQSVLARQESPAHENDKSESGCYSSEKILDEIKVLQGNGSHIDQADSQVINLVAMLFDFILDDSALDSKLKSIIIKLQIPLTKLALIDKTFLINSEHKARQLLNAITKTAQGFNFSEGARNVDPLYNKLEDIVSSLLLKFECNTKIFNDILDDFLTFKSKEEHRAKILEKRTLDAEDGKAKAEVARMTIAVEIELRLMYKKLPKVVFVIIEKVWRNYLFITALKHGYSTLQWRSALNTLDELLASVQPLKTDSERSHLIHIVPDLVKKLQDGFEAISYNPYESSKILKVLEHTHLKLIRGKDIETFIASIPSKIKRHNTIKVMNPKKNVSPVKLINIESHKGDNDNDNKESASDIVFETTHSDGHPTKTIPNLDTSPSTDPNQETLQDDLTSSEIDAVNAFSQGAWFDMKIEENTFARCRLAAFIKPTGKYIFVNRSGMKVAEKTKYELALAVKNNTLKELNNTVLFDRALAAVVSGMRKDQKTNA